jgi:hypothetical protein
MTTSRTSPQPDARAALRAALASLVDPPSSTPSGSYTQVLSQAYQAYLAARAAGTEESLNLRGELPGTPGLVTLALEFAADKLLTNLSDERHEDSFPTFARWRTGLQVLADATGLRPDLEPADRAMRAIADESLLTPDQIPDVPLSHWWWWLPDEPPSSATPAPGE